MPPLAPNTSTTLLADIKSLRTLLEEPANDSSTWMTYYVQKGNQGTTCSTCKVAYKIRLIGR